MLRPTVGRRKNGTRHVHDEDRNGWFSTQTDDNVEQVNRKLQNDRRLTISALPVEFSNIGRPPTYTIVIGNLGIEKAHQPAQRAENVR